MYDGGADPFERPIRPDRVDLVRQTAEGFSEHITARAMIEASETFETFRAAVTWSIYEGLQAEWADTMVAEIEEGMNGAESALRSIYAAGQSSACQS